jgi:hypothetical protein
VAVAAVMAVPSAVPQSLGQCHTGAATAARPMGDAPGICHHCGRHGGDIIRDGVPLHRGCVAAWEAMEVPDWMRRH